MHESGYFAGKSEEEIEEMFVGVNFRLKNLDGAQEGLYVSGIGEIWVDNKNLATKTRGDIVSTVYHELVHRNDKNLISSSSFESEKLAFSEQEKLCEYYGMEMFKGDNDAAIEKHLKSCYTEQLADDRRNDAYNLQWLKDVGNFVVNSGKSLYSCVSWIPGVDSLANTVNGQVGKMLG